MKQKLKSLLVLFIIFYLITLDPLTMTAYKTDYAGEVLNFAPTVNFELKEKKKVDVIVDVGTTKLSIAEVNSLVNAQLRPKLQEAGYDFKLHVEKSNEGATQLYYFAGNDHSDPYARTLYAYDLATNTSKKLYETPFHHFTLHTIYDPHSGLVISGNRVYATDQSPIPTALINQHGWEITNQYNVSQPLINIDGKLILQGYRSANDSYVTAYVDPNEIITNILQQKPNSIQWGKSYIWSSLYSRDQFSQVYLDGSILKTRFNTVDMILFKNPYDTYMKDANPSYYPFGGAGGNLGSNFTGASYSKETGEIFVPRSTRVYSDSSVAHYESVIYNPKTAKTRVFSDNNRDNYAGYAFGYFLDGKQFMYKDTTTNGWMYYEDYTDKTTAAPLIDLIGVEINQPVTHLGENLVYSVYESGSITHYIVDLNSKVKNKLQIGSAFAAARYPSWYISKTRYITNIIDEVPYRSDAEKYYIRLDETDILHLRSSKNLAKTVNALSRQQVNYIAIGNQHNTTITSKIQSALSQNSMHYNISQLGQSLNQIGAYITDRKEIDLHVLAAQSGQAKTAIEASVTSLIQQLRTENIIVKPHYIYGTSSSKLQELYNSITWNPNKNQYVLFLHTATMNELTDQAFLEGAVATLSSNYAHYMQIGSNSNRSIAESIIKLNENRGKFYSGTSYSSYYADIKQYMIDTALKNPKRVKDVLVLQHDPATNEYSAEINVNLYYDDYETDRKRNERFKTTQDPTIYENHNGLMDGIGQYLEAPTTRFTKVGLYEMTMQAQDEPISNPAFSEYWKWSQDSLSLLRLYVHRAPVAKFSAVVRPNRTVAITDYSYDLDRYSRINRGIVEWEWKWKKLDDSDWTAGQLTQLANNTDYFIALRVKDMDGAWSNEHIQFVTTNPYNQPPVALFKIEPAMVSHRANATITDLSYDPDGDAIVKREWIAKKDGQVIWSKVQQPTKAQLQAAASKPLGSYEISLRVTDAHGEVSEWHTEWLEVVNYPPLANFDDLVETDRDSLNKLVNTTVEPDPDGDAVSYKWSLQYKDKTYNLGTSKHPQFTIKNYGLGKAAIGEWYVTLQASDSLGASSKLSKAFNVINHTPTAEITSSPPFAYIDETYSFTSNDDDRDSEDKSSLKSYWRLTAPSGKIRMFYQKSLTNITFDEKGPHLMEHWAEDQLGAVSESVSVSFNVLNKRPVADFTRTPITTYRGSDIAFKSLGTDYDGWIEGYRFELMREGSTPLTLSTDAEFTRSFSSIGTYDIQHTVTDNDGASDSITKKIYIVNRAPKAEVLDPSGTTAAAATEYNSLTPTIRWRMTDADGDQQVQYQLQLKAENGSVLRTTAITTSANQAFTIPSGWLAEGPKYRVSVRVFDGYDWSDYAADKYFYVQLNRPPLPGFTYLPAALYEGDTLRVHHKVDDPDFDSLTVRYEVTAPNGQKISYPSASSGYKLGRSEYSSAAFTIQALQPGAYTIKQTVDDGKAAPVQFAQTLTVAPLGIAGQVSHTELWESYRQAFNADLLPNSDKYWHADQFYSGERLVLTADTTLAATESTNETYALSVIATLHTTKTSVKLQYERNKRWTGSMWQESFSELAKGKHTITFAVTYSNGVSKQEDVEIEIIGKAAHFSNVQRWK